MRHSTKISRFAVCLLVGTLLPCLFVFATRPGETVESGSERTVRARLVSETNDASRPFAVGIRFSIADHWYLYWKNPGDAGLPIDVQWNLPKGFTADPISFPVPKKKMADDALCYIYEKDVVLMTTIRPPADYMPGTPVRITAYLDWLVCKERCVRGGDTVSLTLGSIPDDRIAASRALLGATWAALPRPLSTQKALAASATMVRHSRDSVLVLVAVAGKGASENTDFFPIIPDDFVLNYAAIRGGRGSFRIPLLAATPEAQLSRLEGLLVVGNRGFEVSIPVRGADGSDSISPISSPTDTRKK
ncbi:MAG: hypothetical protein HY962_15325 [Ignavibacteriae bacterium]|nr:hypothetical protein [Ignavibacteriota bacterium]